MPEEKKKKIICFKCGGQIKKGIICRLTVCVSEKKEDNRQLPGHQACYNKWWNEYQEADPPMKKEMDENIKKMAKESGLIYEKPEERNGKV